ncbi:hypothetical protein N7523_001101 [Penicillium sp. IBT 18751x]|nr:hypothetical protein N7523_001101 [Penicillium sp. IBT 18751x]
MHEVESPGYITGNTLSSNREGSSHENIIYAALFRGNQGSAEQKENKSKHENGWRYVVRNFTPARAKPSFKSWFSVNMGTGITSILLNTLPYNGRWLYWISVGIFCLNVLIFGIFLTITVLRYLLYPEIFKLMITHPAQSMFVGTFPMGFATIINMLCFVCVPAWGAWGAWAAYFAWGVWIVDAVVSIMTCFGIPYILCATTSSIKYFY